jgi:hypothetical protein
MADRATRPSFEGYGDASVCSTGHAYCQSASVECGTRDAWCLEGPGHENWVSCVEAEPCSERLCDVVRGVPKRIR